RGRTVQAVVQGRDDSPATLDRPAVTGGTWVRPGGVVVEHAFAAALDMRIGDTVSIDRHPLRVDGTAVTAARAVYPRADWRADAGSPLTESAGLVWVDRGEISALAGARPLSYALNLRYADPHVGTSFTHKREDGIEYTSWTGIAEANGRLVTGARLALLVGSWLLTALAVVGVANIVAGRIADQRRRVGLLKAVGAGPAMVATVHLAEHLVVGLAAAGTGLAAGWLAAPALTDPGAGLLGATGTPPPGLRAVVAGTALALAIAAAATLAPVLRAATTDTVHALADAATPPRRRGWRVWLSRRMPTALLIGVRVNARRPRRARLVMVNTLITTTGLAALLMGLRQDRQIGLGGAELANPRDARTIQAMLLVIGVLCALGLVNAVVSTWTAVLDARHPLAVARTLGATPAQVTMVPAAGDYVAAPTDELSLRTLPTFFEVLRLLLTAGVTTVAEAAFQDRLWRPGLQPLLGIADVRVVHCQVTAQAAFDRVRRRQDENATRRAHADAYLGDRQTHALGHRGFQPVRLAVPEIEVDTSDGYRPGLDEIAAFVNAGR
ncbi:hypothetical protein QLR68_26835, partial [Micromonospora sp. DH15]|nr:hypothetical protein [Micromonospora sp. DH15]